MSNLVFPSYFVMKWIEKEKYDPVATANSLRSWSRAMYAFGASAFLAMFAMVFFAFAPGYLETTESYVVWSSALSTMFLLVAIFCGVRKQKYWKLLSRYEWALATVAGALGFDNNSCLEGLKHEMLNGRATPVLQQIASGIKALKAIEGVGADELTKFALSAFWTKRRIFDFWEIVPHEPSAWTSYLPA